MSLNQLNDGSESLKNTSGDEETRRDTPGDDSLSSTTSQSPQGKTSGRDGEKRRVTFPEDDSKLITGYLEPVNPWQSVGEISGSELIEEYTASCLRHHTTPQQAVLDQLKEFVLLGSSRSGVLSLSSNPLLPAQCEALEAVLRRARFNRIEACNAALTDETAVALFDMLEYYESACELDISCNTEFGILGWQACSRMVNKCQGLEQLEARGTSLSENTAPVLGRGLRSPCALRVLHLQRAGLRGRPMLCLASALKQNKSVRELHIGDNNLLAEDAGQLASLLRCNTFLQLLDISNNDIQDLGVERIADALSEQCTPSPSPSSSTSTSSSSPGDSIVSSPQSATSGSYQARGLAVLIVWNNNLTRNSGQHLSKALTRCKSLEVLNIGQNPLGGEAINRVRAALQQNRSLLCLGVQGARLGAEAGVALAEVIEDNHCIQRIDLRDNKLQTAGLLALATALRKNYALTRLDLDDALPPHNNGLEQPLEETRLIDEIRSLCRRNENQQNQLQSSPSTPTSEENLHRRRVASFSTRKISLTCQTLHRSYEPAIEPALSPPKMPSGRLRSPLPSPVPSPASSPIPSPSHRSRFIVSRVSDSSSVTSESSSPSTPPGARNFFPNSRFKVVSVQEPPKINVTMAAEEIKNNETNRDLNRNLCHDVLLVKNDDNPAADDGETKSNTEVTAMGQGDTSNLIQNNQSLTDNIVDVQDIQLDECKPDDNVCPVISAESQTENQPPPAIKKNKSESSLDSPDLEVSRLMLKKETYDSSSSLDISGSSMESLNNIESSANNNLVNSCVCEEPMSKQETTIFSSKDETEDVFPTNDYKNPFICSVATEGNAGRKKLSASSNESSLESSTFESGVMITFPHHAGHQSNLLNSSVSSNESVSPNIFGKHMKLHGSVTSLEASVSSLDSCRSKNDFISPQNPNAFSFPTPESSQLIESIDSGISQSDNKGRTPSFNESFSSNEGTLTSSSNLKSSMFSMGGDSSLSIEEDEKSAIGETPVGQQLNQEVSPRRVASLLDVPSMQKSPRMRKISWIAPSNFNPTQQSQLVEQPEKKDDEQYQQAASTSTKVPSSLEKLLSLFQHPGSLFSRSDAVEKKSNDSSQSSSRRDSQTSMSSSGSFWPWNLSNTSSVGNTSKSDNKSATIGAIERLKKYGESFETALQFSSDNEKKADLHASKSDTYLENKDSENTLTTDMADRLKDTLLARASKKCMNFDNNPDFQYSRSPPIYSVGSEYLKQTLATCIIHPFQNPNVSADFTLKLNETRTQCTCGETLNSADPSSSVCDNESENVSYSPPLEESYIKSIPIDEESEATDIDSGSKDSASGTNINAVNEVQFNPNDMSDSVGITEQSDKIENIGDWNQEFNKISVELSDINFSNTSAETKSDMETVDKQLPETLLYEMGSVFKFHDVYENYEDSDEHHRKPLTDGSSTVSDSEIVNSTNKKVKDTQNTVRVLTESERQNISEIVKNVCEEAVKSVAAKTKRIDGSLRICDTLTSANRGQVITNDKLFPEAAGDKGVSEVQNIEMFDCDNGYSILANNQGCLCDSNNYCKYNNIPDSCTHSVVNNNCNNSTKTVDLTKQSLETDDNVNNSCHSNNMVVMRQPTDVDESTRVMIDESNKIISNSDSVNKKDFNLDLKREVVRPTELSVRTTPPKQITMVLKQSIGLENKTSPNDRQPSPESGPSVSNLPSKIIRRIKENVSPENTLTSSMSNTKALAQELMERNMVLGANAVFWEFGLKDNVEKILEDRNVSTSEDNKSRFYDELLVEPFNNKFDEIIKVSLPKDQQDMDSCLSVSTKYDENSSLCDVDQGSDVLTVMELMSDEAITIAEADSILQSALDDDGSPCDVDGLTCDVASQDVDVPSHIDKLINVESIAIDVASQVIAEHDQSSQQMGISETGDIFCDVDVDVLSYNDKLINVESIAIDVASQVIAEQDQSNQQTEISEIGDIFCDEKSNDFKPISILKQATPSISKTVSLPKDIPEATKPYPYYGFTLPTPKKLYDTSVSASSSLPMRCGSLPENTSLTLSGDETMDSLTLVQSRRGANPTSPIQNKLGKLARDSLYALNMSEDEIKEYRSSARLSSMDSVRSLGSLSEDLEGLSSSSYVFQSSSDRESILEQGASQDSLVSLESISENVSEGDNVQDGRKTYDSV